MKTNDMKQGFLDEIVWEIKVPIFKNNLILKQLGIAIGIPFGALVIFLIAIRAYNGVLLIGITFCFALLLIAIVFRGTYDVRYELTDVDICCLTQKSQEEKVKILSILTVLFGLFKSNPTVTGAGLLSYKSTKVKIPFKRIRKIKYYKPKRLIMVYGGFTENIALFCTDENYSTVQQFIQARKGDA